MSSPKVGFKQKLQTTEASRHAHVDTKHIALSKLQSSPQVDVSKQYLQWIPISYEAIKFENML